MLFWTSLISCGIGMFIGVYGFLNACSYEKNELKNFDEQILKKNLLLLL